MKKSNSHCISLNDEAWGELIKLQSAEKIRHKRHITNSQIFLEIIKSHYIRLHISGRLRELTNQVDGLNTNEHESLLGIKSILHDLCRDIEGR